MCEVLAHMWERFWEAFWYGMDCLDPGAVDFGDDDG